LLWRGPRCVAPTMATLERPGLWSYSSSNATVLHDI
jgi:hypothetical protein